MDSFKKRETNQEVVGWKAHFFACPSQWIELLPEGVKPARTRTELWGRAWELLVLTPKGWSAAAGKGRPAAGSC